MDGYPEVIPMNFVYIQVIDPQVQSLYMHSHPIGEKLEMRKCDSIDKHVCFLHSYYFHPSDASQPDTSLH